MSKNAYQFRYKTPQGAEGRTTIYHYSKTEALDEIYKLFPVCIITYFHGC